MKVIVLTLALLSCRKSPLAGTEREYVEYQDNGPERIFDTYWGDVACSGWYQHQCGVMLFRCHDGRVYRCLQNVRERER